MSRKYAAAVAAVVVVVVGAGAAQATMVTFEFGGVVTSVQDPAGALGGGVHVNDTFSGTFTFDSTTPDSIPGDPTLGDYQFADAHMTLLVGSVAVSSELPTYHWITVANNRFGFNDGFSMGGSRFDSGGLWVTELGINLNDPSMTAFNSDTLPVAPPDLARFATKSFSFQGQGGFDVRGNVTILTPEPGALSLLAISASVCRWASRTMRSGRTA